MMSPTPDAPRNVQNCLPASWPGRSRHHHAGSAVHPMVAPSPFLRAAPWQATAIAVAFLLGVWITFADIVDEILPAGHYSTAAANSATAPQPFAGDILLHLVGYDVRVGVTERPSGRARPSNEELPITENAPKK